MILRYLLDYQKLHFIKLLNSQQKLKVSIDTSTTGAGKTIIAISLAKRLSLPLLVICPAKLITKWKKDCKYMAYPNYTIQSIDSLYSEKTGLVEIDDGEVKINHKNFPDQPTLLVVDECHMAKNMDTNRSEAIKLISEAIKYYDGNIHIMSATITDKYEQFPYIFAILGLGDDLDSHYRFAKQIEDIIHKPVPYYNEDELNLTYEYLLLYCFQFISSNMVFRTFHEDSKNLFCDMEDEDVENINSVINKARLFMKECPRFHEMTKYLHKIESLKINIFERMTRKTLKENKNNKVIVFLHYNDSIDTLNRLMSDYNPLVLTGSVPSKKRDELIEKFNRPDRKYRLLIANPQVGGTGYDLDDKDGNYPRTTFISPSFNTTDDIQAIGRTCRATTKSKSTIRFLYVKHCEMETRLRNTSRIKSKILKEMSNNLHIKYPCDYVSVDENGNEWNIDSYWTE